MGSVAFLTKPTSKPELIDNVRRYLRRTSGNPDEQTISKSIIYRSRIMAEQIELAQLVAGSNVTILLTGATGTGKEIFARAIHESSPRKAHPFIAINCGAIPEQLLESELFGHEKGVFSGAISRHEGLFQAANGGTLFLDEIGDMPLALQVKLYVCFRTLRSARLVQRNPILLMSGFYPQHTGTLKARSRMVSFAKTCIIV